MFFLWNIKKLKEELIQNGLSQKSLFIYILIYVLTAQFFTEFSFIFPVQYAQTSTWIQAFIDLAVVGIGTYLCFYANGARSGVQFAERYFSICFVVGLRFVALMIPAFFLFGVAWAALVPLTGMEVDGPEMHYATVILTSSWLTLMFWRVITHINNVAKTAHTGSSGAP